MWDLLSQPTVRAGLAVGILFVVVYAAIQVVSRLRPSNIKADTSVDELAQNFEEMRLEGDIDEAELRKIKTVLERSQDSHSGLR